MIVHYIFAAFFLIDIRKETISILKKRVQKYIINIIKKL